MMKLRLVIFSIVLAILGTLKFASPEHSLSTRAFINKIKDLPKSAKPNDYLDEAKLLRKLERGLPHWAHAQINEDLSHFTHLNKQYLDEVYRAANSDFNRLVRFEINQGSVRAQTLDPKVRQSRAFKTLNTMFQYIASKHFIEHADFIVCMQDYMNIANDKVYPIFTFAKDNNRRGEKDLILMPDWMNLAYWPKQAPLIEAASHLYPWAKKEPLLFWRGGHADSTGFRHHLVDLSKRVPDEIDARFSHAKNQSNAAYLKPEFHLKYKYQITVDGARATWERLVWQLHTNCLTFKHRSSQSQWFYKGLSTENLLIQFDNEQELLEKLRWARTHDAEAFTIMVAGKKFAQNNLSLEDMYHYVIELLRAYTKNYQSRT